jgi:hypothetical protein
LLPSNVRGIQREREKREERKEKVGAVVGDTTFKVGGKKHFFSGFESAQTVPAHPSCRVMFERGQNFRHVERAALY